MAHRATYTQRLCSYLLMSKKFEHFRSQLGISVQIAAFIVGFPGTHKDKEQEKNCTQWVEIFLKEYHLRSRAGVFMTTFYLYCSVNHQSHLKETLFQNDQILL